MTQLPPCRLDEWLCPGPLGDADFARLRRRMVLDHFKWDPQVGDVETLARFPLVLPSSVANDLARMAESLAAETVAAEGEFRVRPELHHRIGFPRRLWRMFGKRSELTPRAARVMRFDFHPTADGWRISEANSDVPGGYTESSHFPRLMADHFPGCQPAGDPIASLIEATQLQAGFPSRIGLLAAPGYMEDQQVIACLAQAFRQRGWKTVLGRPSQLEWEEGHAILQTADGSVPLDCVFRFFQGEWLPRLRSRYWRQLFVGGRTPVCNPGIALLTESKRFPLIWDKLKTPVPTWQALLPETRDPRSAPWRRDADWLLKRAFGNNGDEVIDREFNTRRDWRKTVLAVRFWPRAWVAQRRFEARSIATPDGPRYPCLGVYTVNGRFSGIYGRIAAKPFIDYAAADVAVLIRDEPGDSA
jgi:glutathionylspermidine synthase